MNWTLNTPPLIHHLFNFQSVIKGIPSLITLVCGSNPSWTKKKEDTSLCIIKHFLSFTFTFVNCSVHFAFLLPIRSEVAVCYPSTEIMKTWYFCETETSYFLIFCCNTMLSVIVRERDHDENKSSNILSRCYVCFLIRV